MAMVGLNTYAALFLGGIVLGGGYYAYQAVQTVPEANSAPGSEPMSTPGATTEAKPAANARPAAPEPKAVPGSSDIAQPELESEPEPERELAEVSADARVSGAPSFDVVRLDPEGLGLVAGKAEPGADVSVLLDETIIDVVQADSSGSFVSFLAIGPSSQPRVLALVAKRGAVETASDDQIILSPVVPQDLASVAADAVKDGAGPQTGAEPSAGTQHSTAPETGAGQAPPVALPPQAPQVDVTIAANGPAAPAQTGDQTPEVGRMAGVKPGTSDQIAAQPTAHGDQIAAQALPRAPAQDTALELARAPQAADNTAQPGTAPNDTLPEQLAAIDPDLGRPATAREVLPAPAQERQLQFSQVPTRSEEATQPEPAAEQLAGVATGGAAATPASTATAADASRDGTPRQVALFRANRDGVSLIQPGNTERPVVLERMALDTISYSDVGEVQLTGRARDATVVRVYLNNRRVSDLRTDGEGRWFGEMGNVTPGLYTLRLDEIGPDGAVLSRIETPFKREAPEALTAASLDPETGRRIIRAVTVQTGDTLWAISRRQYGEGLLYLRVFEANQGAIRNPDLIYPGQVFTLPR